MLTFACGVCRTRLQVPDEQAGKVVRCPRAGCGAMQQAPSLSAAVRGESAQAGSSVSSTAGGADPDDSARTTVAAPSPPRDVDFSTRLPPPIRRTNSAPPSGRRYGFNCQYCSSRLEAVESNAGNEGVCPTCGSAIVIPILDRYGRLIDPMTGKVIKQDPHPVHAYAAAGERAPRIVRRADKSLAIQCNKCQAVSDIRANNCKSCGMPFTMEGTTAEAAGSSNGFAVASLVLGIIGIPAFCTGIVPVLALIFGSIALIQARRNNGPTGMAIAGVICGGVGILLGLFAWFN